MSRRVYVVTEGDDPFVAGGEPRAAFTAERDAWDYLAERVAELAAVRWERERQLRHHHTTTAAVMAGEASVWDVYAVEVRS